MYDLLCPLTKLSHSSSSNSKDLIKSNCWSVFNEVNFTLQHCLLWLSLKMVRDHLVNRYVALLIISSCLKILQLLEFPFETPLYRSLTTVHIWFFDIDLSTSSCSGFKIICIPLYYIFFEVIVGL